MLDQNTDRMWYVIGAVIVGAALIFLMNGTFPTLFANVGETFEDKVGETTEMTDGIMPKQRVNLLADVAQPLIVEAKGSSHVYSSVIELDTNTYYTFNADVDVLEGSGVTQISVLPYYWREDGTQGWYNTGAGTLDIVDGKISASFHTGKDVSHLLLYAGRAGETSGNTIQFTNVKLYEVDAK